MVKPSKELLRLRFIGQYGVAVAVLAIAVLYLGQLSSGYAGALTTLIIGVALLGTIFWIAYSFLQRQPLEAGPEDATSSAAAAVEIILSILLASILAVLPFALTLLVLYSSRLQFNNGDTDPTLATIMEVVGSIALLAPLWQAWRGISVARRARFMHAAARATVVTASLIYGIATVSLNALLIFLFAEEVRKPSE